mmetsp:Transcript_69130/g.224200  ORF Transcript_69130/g.224200 Transcript_69130/m.224200 type:complete len:204 (+) Transcript_69130:689-1300(+)
MSGHQLQRASVKLKGRLDDNSVGAQVTGRELQFAASRPDRPQHKVAVAAQVVRHREHRPPILSHCGHDDFGIAAPRRSNELQGCPILAHRRQRDLAVVTQGGFRELQGAPVPAHHGQDDFSVCAQFLGGVFKGVGVPFHGGEDHLLIAPDLVGCARQGTRRLRHLRQPRGLQRRPPDQRHDQRPVAGELPDAFAVADLAHADH